MNITVALLGLALAQPPAPEYHPFNTRSIKFPISYAPEKAKQIRQVELYVCKNGDQVWQQVDVAPPTKDTFQYTAPDDGRYWFHIVTVDLQGKKDPANLTVEPPAMKVLIDTKPPAVAFTSVKRNGEEVVVEWRVDDHFPKDEVTQVFFRPASAVEGWQEVTLPPNSKTGVRFPTGTSGPVVVKVAVQDMAGNRGEGIRDIPGSSPAAPPPSQSTSLSSPGAGATVNPPPPPLPAPNAIAAAPAGGVIPPPPDSIVPPGPTPPTAAPLAPTAPPTHTASPTPLPAPVAMQPAPVASTPPAPTAPVVAQVPAPTFTPPAPMLSASTSPAAIPSQTTPSGPAETQPIPTFDPRNTVTPTGGTIPASTSAYTPSGPVAEAVRAQVINTLRFDLNYQVEQRGPSGISRVDLWVTRDEGRSWVWWSKHDGRDPAVKVNLGAASAHPAEGAYGFRLVPVSGAGLSENTPVPGDAPDIRVVVDVTPPEVQIFPATSDPASSDTLVIRWKATDKNFTDDPISLEWGESPSGPWRPVTAGGMEAVVQAGATNGAAARRLPNTGSYSWRVPAGIPPRVYLKVAARDAAGNVTEQVTSQPILIDLTRPRAKITGIGVGPVHHRP